MNKQNLRINFGLTAMFLLFILFTGYSQERMSVADIKTDWTFFKEVKGLKFYVKQESVEVTPGKKPLTFVLVRIENTTNKDVTALYNLAVHYNFGCTNCGTSQEGRKPVVIPANGSVEGKYDNGNTPLSNLLVNPNLNNGWIPELIAIEQLIIN